MSAELKWIWIGSGGVAGVLLRYAAIRWMGSWMFPFPLATFAINVSGSFLAGIAYVMAIERGLMRPELGLALMIGFLGGLTTFSSYSLESVRLLETRAWGTLLLYFVGSPVLGFLAAWIGVRLMRLLLPA